MSTQKLITAVKNNRLKDLSTYLVEENDENVNTKDGEGWTLLHYAVINGNSDMVKVLLKNGADPTQVNNEGDMPLHIASRKGCMDIVNLLLKHASLCKINYIDNKTTPHGDTPLHIAAKNGFTDIVTYLLNHGATYNLKNKDNKIPLDLSKAFTVTRLLKSLEECFEKARKGDMDIIRILKDASVDEFSAIMNARNCMNQPLIQEAMINHHHKLTAKLLEMSVDTDYHFKSDEGPITEEPFPESSNAHISTKEKLEIFKSGAENHLSYSELYIPMLQSMCGPYGTDKNLSQWKAVEKGSYLLGNTQSFLDSYKQHIPGKIKDENIKLVRDTLAYLQFDQSHLSQELVEEAYGDQTKLFVSKGQGTVYYNMLHSDLKVFIDIVEKNLDTPIKRFLDTVTQKLKMLS